jgi:formamidopyrimidine-DNA glycosylase
VPELPEVEAARRLLARVAAGQRITAVHGADDPIVLVDRPSRLRRALLDRRVLGVGRHGKHLWLELDRRPWLTLHFGMSGGVYARGRRAQRLVSHGGRDPVADWPPRFTKLWLGLAGGAEIAFADPRRLGRIRLRDDPRREPPIAGLGFDALRELPPPAALHAALRARALPVKALLLDQTFAAGVGNWVADEVLYQAGVAPRRPARSLTSGEARRLHAALRRVLRTAVAAGADSDRYPRTWLFHRRWTRGSRTARGEAIRHETIGGRTAAWVPAAQE